MYRGRVVAADQSGDLVLQLLGETNGSDHKWFRSQMVHLTGVVVLLDATKPASFKVSCGRQCGEMDALLWMWSAEGSAPWFRCGSDVVRRGLGRITYCTVCPRRSSERAEASAAERFE